jgi:hypothetical protein
MDDASITRLPPLIGMLAWQLWSLEWSLRCVLLCVEAGGNDPTVREAISRFYNVASGETLPVDALTSYESLSRLIERYNSSASVPIDASIVRLRDLLAHGRACAQNDAVPHFSLIKFSQPKNGKVIVESRGELTVQWLSGEVQRVGAAVDLAQTRLREMMGPSDSRIADWSDHR